MSQADNHIDTNHAPHHHGGGDGGADTFADLAARVSAASERISQLLEDLSEGQTLLAGENIRLNIERMGLDDQLRVVKSACRVAEEKCFALQDRMHGLLVQRDRLNREYLEQAADVEMLRREIVSLQQRGAHQAFQARLTSNLLMKDLQDVSRRRMEVWEVAQSVQRATETGLELQRHLWREQDRLAQEDDDAHEDSEEYA